MSGFHVVEPEVAGALGDRTEMDSSIHPPIVKRLHYEFQGWLGDGPERVNKFETPGG